MNTWPYPGDSPLARARRIARAYREHLAVANPQICTQLDATCIDWGEGWVAPRVLRYDLDDWLSPADAADIAAVSMASIRKMRARGRLHGRRTAQGWQYRARDVLALVSEIRRRSGGQSWSATGTLPDKVDSAQMPSPDQTRT